MDMLSGDILSWENCYVKTHNYSIAQHHAPTAVKQICTPRSLLIQSPKSFCPPGEKITVFPAKNPKFCPLIFLNCLSCQQQKYDHFSALRPAEILPPKN
jgi:hypothetical protein